MKTNVSIDLDEAQLRSLASFLAGKAGRRLATRADVKATATGLLMAVVDQWLASEPAAEVADAWQQRAVRESAGPRITVAKADHPNLTRYAKEIEEGLKRHGYAPGSDRAQSYARGWTASSRG